MNYRQLGNTDLQVSEIAVGCSGYWGDRRFSEHSACAIIEAAFERGVNLFDTGHNYSNFNAEPRLGRALRGIVKRGREQVVISTKGGSVSGSAPLFPSRKPVIQDFSADAIETSCLASIRNLGCDYIDIFQLHGMSPEQMKGELADRLRAMRERGLYRYLGINTHSRLALEYIAEHPGLFDVVLLDYNVLQLDREDAIRALHQAGVGVIAGTVLAQGHILKGKTGSIRNGSFFWYLARSLLKASGRQLHEASGDMREVLAAIPEMSPAQAAFAYVLANPHIASCVFGTTSLRNCQEQIEASGKQLSAASRDAIRQAFERLKHSVSG